MDTFIHRKKESSSNVDLLQHMYSVGLMRIEKEFSIEKIV